MLSMVNEVSSEPVRDWSDFRQAEVGGVDQRRRHDGGVLRRDTVAVVEQLGPPLPGRDTAPGFAVVACGAATEKRTERLCALLLSSFASNLPT
jgi:hypothetical protein